MEMPTAVQVPVEVQETPYRALACAPEGFGVAWMDQELPSQNSARVTVTPEASTAPSTAVQVPAEVQDTAERALSCEPAGFGVV